MRLRGQRYPRNARRGFTLLETALAMVIVMVGVVAMVEAQGAFARSNAWSSHEATATYLANELRERMRNLPRHDPVTSLSMSTSGGGAPVVQGVGPESGEVTIDDFDDVDDYDGAKFGAGGNFDGPIDAFGRVIPETDVNGVVKIDPSTGEPMALSGWTQEVKVEKVNPFDFSSAVAWGFSDAWRAVNQFPLRVTVTVKYQDPLSTTAETVTEVIWIVPAK